MYVIPPFFPNLTKHDMLNVLGMSNNSNNARIFGESYNTLAKLNFIAPDAVPKLALGLGRIVCMIGVVRISCVSLMPRPKSSWVLA